MLRVVSAPITRLLHPSAPHSYQSKKSLLQHFPEDSMPYYPTEECWTWVQSPANPDRPSSPPPPPPSQSHDNHSDHFNCQNLMWLQCFQQSQVCSQQNNSCLTDTYIPDNGWPRLQPRCQTTLNDVWGPQPSQAPSSSSQPPQSQHSVRSHPTHNSQ